MAHKKINVAIVGLGFGKEFIPIYRHYPHTNMYAVCQRTKERLDEVANQFGVENRYTDFDDLIRNPEIDAVHINSPIHLHAPQSIAALIGGRQKRCGAKDCLPEPFSIHLPGTSTSRANFANNR